MFINEGRQHDSQQHPKSNFTLLWYDSTTKSFRPHRDAVSYFSFSRHLVWVRRSLIVNKPCITARDSESWLHLRTVFVIAMCFSDVASSDVTHTIQSARGFCPVDGNNDRHDKYAPYSYLTPSDFILGTCTS